MKGSGWVALGVIVIFILFMLLRTFYMDAMNYKLKHQQIVLEELGLLEAKNTLLLSEKSLFVTWNLSALREIFDAGAKGFGSEYWHRIEPREKKQSGRIPTTDEIRAGMGKEIASFRGFSGKENLDAVSLRISTVPAFTIEDAKIAMRVSGTLKTFIGDEQNPSTESPKRIDYAYEFAINFRGLVESATSFVNALNGFAAPAYSGPATAYADNAVAQLRSVFRPAMSGINAKALDVNKAELIIPSANEAGVLAPFGGLLFHYDVNATLEEDTKKENQYYYLDENSYEKRPFSLRIKAEDYLVALNCASSPGTYTYSSTDDMLCSGDIYTCGTYIQGMDRDHSKGCANGVGERVDIYACGEVGFKTVAAVDYSECYCRGFGGNWVGGETWTCPRTVCTPVYNDEGEQTGEDCETVYDYRSCGIECDIDGRGCSPYAC